MLLCVGVLWACAEKDRVPVPVDTALPSDTADPTTSSNGTSSDYFEASLFSVTETLHAWDGSSLDGYRLSDGSEQKATVRIDFYTYADFDVNSADETCTWYGEIQPSEATVAGQTELWNGFYFTLALIESDCENFDPERWDGGDPTAYLASAPLWLGYGPLSNDLDSILSALGGIDDWDTLSAYAFESWFGLIEDGAYTPTLTSVAFAYQLANGQVADQDGSPVLLIPGDDLPQGLIRTMGYNAHPIGMLPPVGR